MTWLTAETGHYTSYQSAGAWLDVSLSSRVKRGIMLRNAHQTRHAGKIFGDNAM